MIIPYRVDVPSDTRPFINWLIVASLIAIFVLQTIEHRQAREQSEGRIAKRESFVETVQRLKDEMISYKFILNGWKAIGLFGHMWLHVDIPHLIGDLIFLWAFGNAICSKIGNIFYLPIYIGLGLIAAISHLLVGGGPALGAGGVISGILGMFLIFFPENTLNCLVAYRFLGVINKPYFGTITIRSFWIILIWVVFNIWGVLIGIGHIACFAHIGGFVGGAVLAILLLKLKWVTMERYEKSLLQLISREKSDEEETRKDMAPWQQQYIRDREVSQPRTIPLEEKQPKVEPKVIEQ